ncbi:MAG TPA: NAD(P)-dependent oxidoreductase [Verrucomicrobiae bacterium]
MRERILITGPGGRVGTQIVPLLREHFALRLFDSQPVAAASDDEVIVGDIQNFDALRKACEGVHAMLHLAAISDEADFHSKLLPVNLGGVYNAFEAARQTGMKTVVFASTGQTILNYGKETHVTTEMPARPSTVYACTKLFGEALARHYSEAHGMAIICIRLCYFRAYDDPLLRIPGHEVQYDWCSPRDLTQLIVKSIESHIRFGVFFGISNNSKCHWDLSNARKLLGYGPKDNAADFLDSKTPGVH